MLRRLPPLSLCIAAAFVPLAAAMTSSDALAAGAYAVDDAGLAEPGSCQIETWLSHADNGDLVAVANPSCVFDLGHPVELSMTTTRLDLSGMQSTLLAPKAKIDLARDVMGLLTVDVAVTPAFDLVTGNMASFLAVVPATVKLSETLSINVNAGVLWDRLMDREYLTYGVGVSWKFAKMLQLTVETFGQAGQSDIATANRPRLQAGLRFQPTETVSLDVIYGHSIQGENANWITVGTTIRFPASEK